MLIRDGSAQPSVAYDAAAVFPAECDGPLTPAPDDAAVLAYLDDLHMVRAFVAEYASGAGVDQRDAGDLVIAVSELAANTYSHTRARGRLSIWATADELICQVEDTGHISDPLAGRRHPDPGGGGQGLWLVHQICDLVELRTGPAGTQIRVHMQLRSLAAESSVT
jgi:anti-sigma regulatory factor (Ser/Thr protein kinase)